MYRAEPDPYCYPGSSILKNKAGLIGEVELEEFESAMTFARANEPLPSGRLSVSHYRAVHHHFFQDVYIWAGKYRTVRLTKGESTFCYPEHIAQEMQKLFSWLKAEQFLKQQSPSAFAEGAAHFISELNAIHPFGKAMAAHNLRFWRCCLSMVATRSISTGLTLMQRSTP